MNFSEWKNRIDERPAIAIAYLTAICAGVQQDRMPLRKYLLLHPTSRLTPEDKQSLCSWTSAEIAKHIERRRRTLVTQSARTSR
jgi:hypothetical protein